MPFPRFVSDSSDRRGGTPRRAAGSFYPPRRGALLRFVALLSAIGVGGPAVAQTEAFSDSIHGYVVEVPTDWSYDHAEIQGPGGSLGVLRGVRADDTLQIFIFSGPADPFDAWLDEMAASLERIGGVEQVTRPPPRPHAGRPAGEIHVDARVAERRVRSWYRCVRVSPMRVWVMVMGRPRDDEAGLEAAGELFRRCADSMVITYDSSRETALAAARERGAAFIRGAGLHHAIMRLRVDQQTRYYLIEDRGRSPGYLELRFSRAQHSLDDPRFGQGGKDGLKAIERVWRFEPDGQVRFQASDLFSSVTGQTDLYEISDALVLTDPRRRPRVIREEVLREADGLVSSVRTNQDLLPFPAPRPKLRLPSDFLGLAWSRTLPAIMAAAAEPQEEMAFSVYDPVTRRLVVDSIRPLPAARIAAAREEHGEQIVDGFEIRRGFDPTPAEVFIDSRGHMIHLAAGTFSLKRVDQEEIERRFGERRDKAAARLVD